MTRQILAPNRMKWPASTDEVDEEAAEAREEHVREAEHRVQQVVLRDADPHVPHDLLLQRLRVVERVVVPEHHQRAQPQDHVPHRRLRRPPLRRLAPQLLRDVVRRRVHRVVQRRHFRFINKNGNMLEVYYSLISSFQASASASSALSKHLSKSIPTFHWLLQTADRH